METSGSSTPSIESRDKSSKRVFIELEYLGSVEDIDLSGWFIFGDFMNENVEFTWWRCLTIPRDKKISDTLILGHDVYTSFEFYLPDNTDIRKKDVIVSYGRKLKYLYYEGMDSKGMGYYARPVFERDFKEDTAHVYLIDKVDLTDKIRLTDNSFYGDDFYNFNEYGLIPFELPPED
jgi:hypothetical protein